MDLRQIIQENRLQIVTFPREFLLNLFNMGNNSFFYTLLWAETLPPDAIIINVSVNQQTLHLEAIVASQEFPPVQPGQLLRRVVNHPVLEKIDDDDIVPEEADESTL